MKYSPLNGWPCIRRPSGRQIFLAYKKFSGISGKKNSASIIPWRKKEDYLVLLDFWFPVGDLYIRSSGPHTARWYHWVSQGSFRELDPLLLSMYYKAANQQALERTLPTKSERNRSKCISSMSYHSESL